MGKGTKIEWAHHTFNPWWGCVKVSPACAHCYAETWAKRTGHEVWGAAAPRRFFGDKHWNEPLKWDREAGDGWFYLACPNCGVNVNYTRNPLTDSSATECYNCDELITARPARPRVFCASMADWLEDREDLTPHLARLLALIHATPHLDWLLLTKRPENFFDRLDQIGYSPGNEEEERRAIFVRDWTRGEPPRNVWIGTTVEDQERAEQRIPQLLKIPARVRFLSCEPLLGPLKLYKVKGAMCGGWTYINGEPEPTGAPGLSWIICGGESGHGARPMEPDWARDLAGECQVAEVPFFFKQWGEWRHCDEMPPVEYAEACRLNVTHLKGPGNGFLRVGKEAAGRLLDGEDWNQLPVIL